VTLAALGDRRAAIRESSELVAEAPDHADVLSHCAMASIAVGELERARELLGRHLELGYAQEQRLHLNRTLYSLGDLFDSPEYADFRREYAAMIDRLRQEYGAAAYAAN